MSSIEKIVVLTPRKSPRLFWSSACLSAGAAGFACFLLGSSLCLEPCKSLYVLGTTLWRKRGRAEVCKGMNVRYIGCKQTQGCGLIHSWYIAGFSWILLFSSLFHPCHFYKFHQISSNLVSFLIITIINTCRYNHGWLKTTRTHS